MAHSDPVTNNKAALARIEGGHPQNPTPTRRATPVDNHQLLDLAEHITANFALDNIMIKTRVEYEHDLESFTALDSMDLLAIYHDLLTVTRKYKQDVPASPCYPFIREDGEEVLVDENSLTPELGVNCLLTAAAEFLALRAAAQSVIEKFVAIYRTINAIEHL